MHTQTAHYPVQKLATVRARCNSSPVNVHPFFDCLELSGVPMTFAKASEIYGENEPADYLYRVVSGAVRTYRVLCDGRRQIGAFYMPGDVFGLESGHAHAFSAEAISDTKVLVIKRKALEAIAGRDSEVARQLWELTGRELERAQDHILALIKTAEERVVSFLLEMAVRASRDGQIELPMSRRDIADYLGLTLETVSRALSYLRERGILVFSETSQREIVLQDRQQLQKMDS